MSCLQREFTREARDSAPDFATSYRVCESERETVRDAGIAALRENSAYLVATERETHERMDLDAVEERRCGYPVREVDVDTTNGSGAIVELAIRHTDVRSDGQPGRLGEILADRGVERASLGSADPVRARAQDERRPAVGLGDGNEVDERSDVAGDRVVLDADRQSREQSIGERRPQRRAIDLIRDGSNSDGPPWCITLGDPTDRPAFARSDRSGGHA